MIESAGNKVPFKGIRRTAARHMIAAWQAPVFHLNVEVDMTEALNIKSVRPGATLTDLLIYVAGRALKAVPELNVHVDDEGVTEFPAANVGLAVATEQGLTVPVIHDVDSISLLEIASRRSEVVERARTGSLTRADITGGTFTISNLGMMGIRRFDAILNVPQAAILAVGATEQRLRKVNGEDTWLPIAEFTLTCDHRAIDGATGAGFINKFAELLQTPLTQN
jgi:pyruvate dehydrogenase E2 component (dihydrolipoamide acetyltransferase)